MLHINWLQEVKELVKLNTCWNIWFFLSNIQGEIVFQKLQNFWAAKVLMSSYILCKILSFQARVTQKVFNTSGSYSLGELIMLWVSNIQNWFFCSSIRNCIAYANEANIVIKDSLINHTSWMTSGPKSNFTVFSLILLAAMHIYWPKRRCLHEKESSNTEMVSDTNMAAVIVLGRQWSRETRLPLFSWASLLCSTMAITMLTIISPC